MKKNNFHKLLAAYIVTVTFFGACKTEFDQPQYTSGTANFGTYVALGNSLTAGFQDNALYKQGQENAYPSMLHEVMVKAGGGAIFEVPYLTGVNATNGVSPSPLGVQFPFRTLPKLILRNDIANCLGVKSLGPALTAAPIDNNIEFYLGRADSSGQKKYNNLGVPGAKSFQLLDNKYGNVFFGGNPFYARFCSNPGVITVVDDALRAKPTFFTLWIGNNDVLLYATSGGVGSNGGMSMNDITPVDTFTNAINTIVAKMSDNGKVKGAIANIPDVADIPYFNTVPYNALSLSKGQADSLNFAYTSYNQGAQALGLPQMVFKEGANAFVITDLSLPQLGNIRQIKAGEFICLSVPQDSIRCANWGSQKPIPGNYVLDFTELNNIKQATTAYNATIVKAANDNGLAFVDMNSFFKTFVKDGLLFNGVTYTTEFVQGGAFSLDGVHPNMRGYGNIANQWIRAINAKFGASLPEIDANKYPGIRFP
ncbi:MAG: hypothetical protein IPO27_06745 [Bacteroidetes bacterium]|nr:hypothetical protein [Bacteroidota bacterium]